MKRHIMAQWINLHQNNSFTNVNQLLLLCEKSEAMHTPSTRSHWLQQASSQASSQTYVFEITDPNISIFTVLHKGAVLL